MIVHLSASAERDLETIADFIAQDDPRRAISFIRELREKCLNLADLPTGFPLVPRYEAEGVRKRRYGRYLIFYRVDSSRVFVLHILNGAQDYDTILGAEVSE
ncbi:type II toxin-antitoxin system RelE/ParE family toxin [Sphingomonas immobilis]|uniref:Type II toxin-antitoxin system RelE/ParE family toxin n=1 Tax=Sphingomonas immobilis TaxID=3063997 RepID=A0ABT9A0R6_9SPHN|nr:type II toxin-antitoxin system RelE/ParE family toxin [Sphingomonas sp. CA1-15]MDO7843047.1 type II toxin-antitoxin system RelE/ParE family toxin [Sphingomonas sp. CA1-15]